ncbi:type II toxin-antitoxin system Phd/YefM family antitoxin [Pedobacter paludis]|uniref:Prevent-host-death protein n=1 Tax=Pedobacter paludis TaxID=2203212 RepID=A0A317F3N2_9SPHI|nr:type II toxin-antitoxin system Phd/YefM family antitoxin [Pedobacter paludis]PWS32943.1 prevent-host-death protein [Pedobacter paludis]
MLVVSSREFREKQAEYMDKLDNGEQIIIQRGKNKAYSIMPIKDEEIYFSPQMIQKIKDSILQAKQGKTIKIGNSEDLEDFFKNL